ncbi:hypothetical protein PUH89_10380 [Rhodobacter capsulatus]|uniref:Uncharacterized protein n=1 Tax=Rhodobacter capsulatus TaxID=1061 RepID=A0A1G7J6T4_RHOCA|nr:hypothetical protein [Rhodobacter capsulatus]WER07752.1 hypothetical protein PUH89_10380 [Rhodobacter capsulatus]SDF20578.1 hypothetical protein SAMN04244550_01838 [Rhodobacter capsulatus]
MTRKKTPPTPPRGTPEIPAPRPTLWFALGIAGALSALWLLGLGLWRLIGALI